MITKQLFKGLVCFILIFGSFIMAGCNSEPKQTLKILSYNVWIGFQRDSSLRDKYIDWVKELNPDIVAYQEMNYYRQRDTETLAEEYSHPFAVQSKEGGFPVALTSRFPIVNVQKVLDNMHHGYLYGVTNNIHVFVIHFTPGGMDRLKKRQEEVKTVLAHAALLPQDDMIMIVGDFNDVSASDSLYYAEESDLNVAEMDFSVIGMVENAGFKDVFRLVNFKFKKSIPTVTRIEQLGSSASEGRRIDHIFVNNALAKHVVYADIIHDEYTDIISDHYPVYVEFRY